MTDERWVVYNIRVSYSYFYDNDRKKYTTASTERGPWAESLQKTWKVVREFLCGNEYTGTVKSVRAQGSRNPGNEGGTAENLIPSFDGLRLFYFRRRNKCG